MAKPGDVLESPDTTIIFHRTSEDTGGDLLSFEQRISSGAPKIPSHVHPRQEERFEVLSGTMGALVGGVGRIFGAGEEVVVPPGVAHAVWNAGDDELRQLVELRPALRLEDFFETNVGLARDGKVNGKGIPRPLQGALLLHEYDVRVPGFPMIVQKPLFSFLACLSRLLGNKARYPRYAGGEGSLRPRTRRGSDANG